MGGLIDSATTLLDPHSNRSQEILNDSSKPNVLLDCCLGITRRIAIETTRDAPASKEDLLRTFVIQVDDPSFGGASRVVSIAILRVMPSHNRLTGETKEGPMM